MSSGTYRPYIYVGHFESAGAAVTVQLTDCPDGAPDFGMVWNETKFATDAANMIGFWTRGYADADASIIVNNDAEGIGVKEATNGLTDASSVSYTTGSATYATATKTMTIGTALAGSDSDEIHFMFIWANKFADLGDQA